MQQARNSQGKFSKRNKIKTERFTMPNILHNITCYWYKDRQMENWKRSIKKHSLHVYE